MTATTLSHSPAAYAAKFINNTNRHIFLTGKAGTGKTTFLKYIIRNTHKSAVIAAPTGIAAINAGGVTLHSLFQLPFGAFVPDRNLRLSGISDSLINTPETLGKNLHIRGTKRRLLQEIELLIIDEVSMLRADLLDAVDAVLRMIRRNSTPFGGVQILFIGDLLQLPPVVKDDEWSTLSKYYKSAYFFDAVALRKAPPLYIELDKIYRQTDDQFISVLNNLRDNNITEHDIEILNKHYKPGFKAAAGENYIYLTTHNRKADSINREELEKLPGKSYKFRADIKGDFQESSFPVEQNLELKKGAQVMFIKNDSSGQQRFFNGKIGVVTYLNDNEIEVLCEGDTESITVDKYEWKNIKYGINEATNEIEENEQGSFTHFPLKLAWAITVHKSQGLTFNKAIIDVGSAFAPGQVYVALSRLTSLDGLVLTSPINFRLPEQDGAVIDFANTKQERLDDIFDVESQSFLQAYVIQCFDFSRLLDILSRHIDTYSKNENRSAKQKYLEWAMSMREKLKPQKEVADKFINQLKSKFSQGNVEIDFIHERTAAAQKYFVPIFKGFTANFLEHIVKVKEDAGTKQYITELKELEAIFYKQLQLINKAEAFLNSALKKEDFTREELEKIANTKERLEQVSAIPDRKRRGEKKPKPERGASPKISFEMFSAGKSIREIAAARSMALTTIEGHLAQYVASGEIDIMVFVGQEKVESIIAASKKLDTLQLSPIKQELGDDVSYGEIRMAMAYYLHKIKEEALQ